MEILLLFKNSMTPESGSEFKSAQMIDGMFGWLVNPFLPASKGDNYCTYIKLFLNTVITESTCYKQLLS